MENEHASKNQLISTHVDDGQLIKNFISAKYMNKSDLNKLSKAKLIQLILRKNAQKQEKNTISSNSMTLKQLSKYLPDAKKLGYTWKQLMKKSTRGVTMNDIQRYRNIKSVHAIIPKAIRDSQKYLELDRKLKQKERLIKRNHERLIRRQKQQRTQSSNEFNFDDSIFDSTSNDQPLFKITEIGNTANKKFNAYTNEFKINVREHYITNKNDIFSVFERLVEMTIKKRQLKGNDRLRLVFLNDELDHPISTKMLKVSEFKLKHVSDVISTLEYKEIDLENCKIIVQSVKIPAGKGHLYLSKQTVNRKQCIITIKNNDTICLARAIVTAYANLHADNYTTSQLKNGFNKSRKLQETQAKELHNNANVEINDYGNCLDDVYKFALYLEVEINIIDSEQFNQIIYTANKGKTDKIYLYKKRNHFDVIKSMTAFLDVAYYCHSCKKSYTRRDKHKCPQKCLACFKYFSHGNKCKGKGVTCKQCNRVFHGNSCFKNHTSNRSKKDDDSVCKSVSKCLKCNQIILKPYIKIHKCGFKMCNNCNSYCESKHKCFMKKIKCKGGNCIKNNKFPCRLNKNIKRKDIKILLFM